MFSEYASRFLAQSQSRLSNFGQADNDTPPRQPDWSSRPSRTQRDGGRGNAAGRSFMGRGYGGNPYQQTGAGSRFGGFASRISAAQDAPLFHSTLDEYREEDDEEERDREAADLFALQRSRRVAAASKLADSVDSDAHSRGSMDESASHEDHPYHERAPRRGLRSSWNGTRSGHRPTIATDTLLEEAEEVSRSSGEHESERSQNTKGKMVDVRLDSQADTDEDPPESFFGEAPTDSSPPAFQKFKGSDSERTPFMMRRDSHTETEMSSTRRPGFADDDEPVQTTMGYVEGEIFRHDPFFAWIFLIALAGMMSTFFLVWLHTSPKNSPVGDTIYITLQKSFNMLIVDTLVAVLVSFVWLAALRSFVRPLVSVILIAVPVIMFSFSIYSFVSSFKGRTHGTSFQDKVLRWAALFPAIACVMWIWMVIKGRRAIQQAIEILQFSSRILAQNSALLFVGFGTLFVIVAWTWIWLGMFTRVFMGGYFSKNLVRFVIQMSSWWLGAAFIFLYMWTVSVINAVHRGTTAATVSQWYFHRNAGPPTPSREIVLAAFNHALTTIFGSICQSTLLSLLIRAPLIFLPRKMGAAVSNIASWWIPTPVVALMNPLTITYSAIHSQNLSTSARGLEQMDFVSSALPTTALTPRALRFRGQSSNLLPYRLAKLLLVATRLLMATAMGFAGWIITAKQLRIQLPDGVGIRGSAYAYVVGIMASFIGYSVMGAMEGILAGIVDAVLICYGSERRMERGHGRFCLEAAYLFGERRGGDDREYA